ncbi:MAG: c-type cytochrome, partial [Verrucomicrobiota bacterium]
HSNGRIFRITYPERPLVKPTPVAGASIEQLLENLKLPEYRTRYRTRRELRMRGAEEVLSPLKAWSDSLKSSDENYEHHLLEALWVSWGLNRIDVDLLRTLLNAASHRVRAAAVRALRYNRHLIDDHIELLNKAARDQHGRVRLEVLAAASWMDNHAGLTLVEEVGKTPQDKWSQHAFNTVKANLSGMTPPEEKSEESAPGYLTSEAQRLWIKGAEIYKRDGHCMTCHQADGQGLAAAGFPPLAETAWVNGNKDRLIKLTLNGLMGPIKVKGKSYPGLVPMTQFGGLLTDEDIAAVLTYVRNSFGNKSAPITVEKVKSVREASKGKTGFWSPADLLKQHPLEH